MINGDCKIKNGSHESVVFQFPLFNLHFSLITIQVCGLSSSRRVVRRRLFGGETQVHFQVDGDRYDACGAEEGDFGVERLVAPTDLKSS